MYQRMCYGDDFHRSIPLLEVIVSAEKSEQAKKSGEGMEFLK